MRAAASARDSLVGVGFIWHEKKRHRGDGPLVFGNDSRSRQAQAILAMALAVLLLMLAALLG